MRAGGAPRQLPLPPKPKAAFLGGFAVVRVTERAMDVVLCEAANNGGVTFDQAFNKTLGGRI